jgi:hypothetical protein
MVYSILQTMQTAEIGERRKAERFYTTRPIELTAPRKEGDRERCRNTRDGLRENANSDSSMQ